MTEATPKALVEDGFYPAVLDFFGDALPGRILDVPSGYGAFSQLLKVRGHADIECLDIIPEAEFQLANVNYQQYDAANRLPYPDNTFDYVFSLEGIEHFDSPFPFVIELCRVLKPGGKLYLSTPNTFSVDARIKYLLSGYFPRFRPLMLDPTRVMDQPVDDAHISPIYFWQLNYFLLRGGVSISRVSTHAVRRAGNLPRRWLENMLAKVIRSNIRRRRFPDSGVSSEAMLFGDSLIVEGIKA
jgi:SAM-dependent methyltransferase